LSVEASIRARAANYESGGQEFESLRARQKLNKNRDTFILFIEIRHAELENLHGICMANGGVCLSRHERPSGELLMRVGSATMRRLLTAKELSPETAMASDISARLLSRLQAAN
jgi:hypothetical protein